MTRKSRGTYVLVFGVVVVVAGLALLPLPGPGAGILAAGIVVAAIGTVLLLFERNAAKIEAMGPAADRTDPPQ